MLMLQPSPPPHLLRGAALPSRELLLKGLAFVGVVGAISGIVWAASRPKRRS
jgi:hypothetical protein